MERLPLSSRSSFTNSPKTNDFIHVSIPDNSAVNIMNPSFFPLSNRHRSVLTPLALKPTTPNDFAPRSSVKQKPPFSPEISPEISPLGRKYPSLRTLDTDREDEASFTGPRCMFTYRDAKALDRADRARHEALRDTRRAEMEEMNARFEARRANRNIKMEQELQRQKERWQQLKAGQKTTTANPTCKPDIQAPPRAGPRKTGAALLEQRAIEKAEMHTRMANRRAANKTVVVLDSAKRNEMEAIIARQATERLEMTTLREESEKIALETTLDHSKPANMFESCGAVEIMSPLPVLAAAERERRQFETGMWLLKSMEAIQARLRRDREAEVAEEDASERAREEDICERVRNIIAMDTMNIWNAQCDTRDVQTIK